jgi:RecA-family ATPase
MTNTETAPHQRKKSPDELRRENQRALAIRLAANDVVIFPSVDKSSVVKEWPRQDTSIPIDEKNKIHDAAKAAGKRRPLHIGSTRKIVVVKKLWSAWPDANPSIPCGVNGLLAIDVDIKRNKSTGEITYHGPQLFEAFCKEKGIIIGPDVPMTRSQSGEGFHLIYRNPLGLGSSAGGFAELGCDIRGGNADGTEGSGQVVAPGAWRADGKRYESAEGHVDFVTAFAEGTIPDLPEAFVKLIGTKPEGAQRSGESKSVSEREVQALADELRKTELPDAAVLLDPALDGFDMPKIEQRYPKFREAIGKGDFSGIIFNLAGALKAERANVTAAEYATALFEREDCGRFDDDADAVSGESYNMRSVARSFLRAVPLTTEMSKGEEFGAVVDESEEDEPVSPEVQAKWDLEEKERAEKAEQAKRDAKLERAKKRAGPTTNMLPLELLGVNSIPPREFIYRKWLVKGSLTVMIAPGGRGKSSITLSQAVDIACGVDRLGAKLARPRAVFLYNAEDSKQEMERRVASYLSQYPYTDQQKALIKKNLFVQSGTDGLLVFATQDRGVVVPNDELVEKLIADIKERNIEVVILDPLATLHGVSENDNIAMTHVVDVFKRIIVATNVAMMICHHSRKVQRGSGGLDANDGRGAVAVINSARIILNLNDIPEAKAAEFQITDVTELWRYVAVTSGDKTNLSARDQSTVIYRMNSVQADNGTAEHEADNTVAMSLHTFERQSSMIGDDATFAVLAKLDGEEPVGSDPRHANYLGKVIADTMGWNFDLKSVRTSVKDIVASWQRSKWIAQEVYENADKGAARRKPVNVYVRGAIRPEPSKAEFSAVEDEDD